MPNLTRITVTIEATQTVAWPHFAGSTLRGAVGRALRQAACITGQDKCTGCPLRQSCAYGVVFDPAPPAQPLHPSFQDGQPRYLVQPPALGACQLSAGQQQGFALLLLPGAQAHLPLIAHLMTAATEKQLMQPGLFKLKQLSTEEQALAPWPAAIPEWASSQPDRPAQITLRWLTPLRLQKQGKPIFKPQLLDATTLVRALVRRHLQWSQLSAQAPADTEPQIQAMGHCQLDTRQMRWHDIDRYSSTQQGKLPLGGLVGSATLHGPAQALANLLPLLQRGEQLHLGKETVMGLGRYQLGAIEPG
jgi:hypothetical protein